MTLTKETDAELEKFIRNIIIVEWGGDSADAGYIHDAMMRVAAFAAKRAKEKAIEECIAICEEKEKMAFLKYRPGAHLCKLHFKKHLLGQSL